jgi:hypothetical protein
MATQKTELAEIKKSGGKPQPNSGRGSHAKADGILEPFCFDVKEYEKSYSLNVNSWAKICTDAFKSGRRVPALKIVLGALGGKRVRLWVISDDMFQEMLEAWREKYEG